MMALRLLILRSVEMLSHADRKHTKEKSDVTHSALLVTMALFSEVVDAVRRCTSNLQYASLFLEVGRQVEPSCLSHLFPLPAPGKTYKLDAASDVKRLNKTSARSVMELFSLCIDNGSLAASASALPLLGSRIQSRNFCDLLLARSIEAFVKNTDSAESKFDSSEEERRVIGDIFRFGMKLEDAAKFEEELERQESEAKLGGEALYPSLKDHGDSHGSFSSESAELTPVQSSSRNLICMGREGSILNYIAPGIFHDDKKEEEAITRAATSFISSSTDFRSLDFLALVDDEEKDNEDTSSSPDNNLKSVGGLVGDALLDLQRSRSTDCCWKTMSALARLLLQDHKHSESAYESFKDAANKAQLDDLIPAIPEDFEGEGPERLTRFIMVEVGDCAHEVTPLEASLIVDLVLVLLQRLADFPLPNEKHSNVNAGLILLTLIAAHVSDRSKELLENLSENSFIYEQYERIVHDLADSV